MEIYEMLGIGGAIISSFRRVSIVGRISAHPNGIPYSYGFSGWVGFYSKFYQELQRGKFQLDGHIYSLIC